MYKSNKKDKYLIRFLLAVLRVTHHVNPPCKVGRVERVARPAAFARAGGTEIGRRFA